MSLLGEILLYSERNHEDAGEVIGQLLRMFRPQRLDTIVRIASSPGMWECFESGKSGSEEYIGESDCPEDMARLYRKGYCVSASLVDSPIIDEVNRAIIANIPESVRDDFIPSFTMLRVGKHDIFECAEHPEGFLIAQPFVSIAFQGYSTPSDWVMFRKLAFALPVIERLRKELEGILGDAKCAAYWSV